MSQQRRHMGLYTSEVRGVRAVAGRRLVLKKIAPRHRPAIASTDRRAGEQRCTPFPSCCSRRSGAKTGLPRTLPLVYVNDGDRLILIASNYGKTSHPAWYRNLVANPKVEVLAGKNSGTYTATEITDPAERDRAWDWRSTCTPATAITRRGRATGRSLWSAWSGRPAELSTVVISSTGSG